MTREEFDRAYRPVRHLQRYSAEERATLAASHRSGCNRRRAMGEYFYTHPLIPDRAFPSAWRARDAGWARYVASREQRREAA